MLGLVSYVVLGICPVFLNFPTYSIKLTLASNLSDWSICTLSLFPPWRWYRDLAPCPAPRTLSAKAALKAAICSFVHLICCMFVFWFINFCSYLYYFLNFTLFDLNRSFFPLTYGPADIWNKRPDGEPMSFAVTAKEGAVGRLCCASEGGVSFCSQAGLKFFSALDFQQCRNDFLLIYA